MTPTVFHTNIENVGNTLENMKMLVLNVYGGNKQL